MQFLAVDEGCGWSLPLAVACSAENRELMLRPHEAASLEITLASGLKGMNELTPGRYVLAKELQFFVGKRGVGIRHHEGIRLVYEVALSVRATN